MIRFFRNIRQKLLSKNNIKKYLLYAVGEIFLVMIGILLALQVNNLNEERKNRALERAYLSDIHYDFLENKIQFEVKQKVYSNQFKLADSLCRRVFPITDENWEQMSRIYQRAFLPHTLNAKSSSVEALIGSGNSNIIQNDSLKTILLSWEDLYDDYKENEEALLKWWDILNDIYLNEPDWSNPRNDSITPISRELKIKLEKLMWKRRADLGLSISKWQLNQESEELRALINTIISLTEPFTDKHKTEKN